MVTRSRRRAWWSRAGALVLLGSLVTTGCAAQPTSGQAAPTTVRTQPARVQALAAPVITVGGSVWVNVSVATLWTSRTAPRPVDAKALSAPVDIRGWLAAMSYDARRALVGRVETQALYGERLLVTWTGASWLHVVALGQPTSRDRRGYPGWVPRRQVTSIAPLARSSVATVVQPSAWLRTSTGQRQIEVSIATRLPVLARTTTAVTVATPTHGRLTVTASAVVIRSPLVAAFARTPSAVISTGKRFIGLPYLWGGRSGFAVDCSGLTELIYALHGVRIPRDANDQATAGRAAWLGALHPADLLFYRNRSGAVTHVALYIGSGRRLHAPNTGSLVQIAPMGTPALARRFL